MLKKCVAIACTAVLGGAMIVGFVGCDNKPKTNPPPDTNKAPDTATPAADTPAHDQPADKK